VGSLWTLKQAQSDGKLVPGALVFILERDGKEPARYKADGLGNASHVGIYVGQSDVIWSVDASSSAGRVRTRTKRDAPHVWTHVGYLPEIDYTTRTPTQPTVARPIPTVSPNSVVTTNINPYSIPAFIPYDAVVLESGAGRVRVRKAPAGEYHGHISTGQIVNVIDEVPDWSKLRWKTGTYWMMSKYLAKR
jgi:hypothetical protein